LYLTGLSLSEVLLSPPAWWTATAKARTVVGIALVLRFAHGHGLLHGSLKASNVLFDGDGRVQVADFSSIRLEAGDTRPFSGDEWSPSADVRAFTSLLSEIVGYRTATASGCAAGPPNRASDIPEFVSEMIEEREPPFLTGERSFINIVEILKANDFQIVAGVDSASVLAFVSSIELLEQNSTRE
jgi:serine/threonine protein kinase